MLTRTFHADRAWLSARAGEVRDVVVHTVGDRVTRVETGVARPDDAVHLPGLVLPGLVNAHSHAFHRALRGRTHGGQGDFWSWRRRMYTVVDALTPDRYLALARAVYAEMALAGITTVVEFHYVHHDRGGARYASPAMEEALAQAAVDAGIRLTLLDTCYLQADVDGSPLTGPQLRFGDGDADAWLERVDGYAGRLTGVDVTGAAVHSVRACPPEAMRAVANWTRRTGAPLHLHLSEQPRENEACLAVHGRTPAALCAESDVLGPATTAVHATHLTDDDIALLGGTATMSCLCPTTERDLADGIGPSTELARAGSPLCVGSDSHAVIDLFEETRAIELDERLRSLRRGSHRASDLLTAATVTGAASAGMPDAAGRIEVGALADFIAVDDRSVRLAGAHGDAAATVVFAATAADVTHVVRGGRLIVSDGRHRLIDDVAAELTAAINVLYDD